MILKTLEKIRGRGKKKLQTHHQVSFEENLPTFYILGIAEEKFIVLQLKNLYQF